MASKLIEYFRVLFTVSGWNPVLQYNFQAGCHGFESRIPLHILNLKLIYSLFGSLDIITDGKNLVRISRADVIEMT